VHNADAGLHLAARLAAGLDDRDVVDRMARRGLTATALTACYAGASPRSGLLLGFGGSTERRLLEATRVVGEVLR
jgi:GntR family transcriptional regulator/MocR family aminotransferase